MDDELRDYRPVHPRSGLNVKRILERLFAALLFLGGLAIKFGFVFLKFFGLFVSIAAYALIWGWQWGVGFVALIFVHEMGHFFEARRQGLEASWPSFIPFFGAYVLVSRAGLTPWRNARVSLAGPFLGGIGAAVCWEIGNARSSQLFMSLAFSGFLLNLINMAPIGFLDGGQVAHAAREAWRMPVIHFEGGVPMRALEPDRRRALLIWALYLGIALLLVVGAWKTHVPQHRL
jgi:Zn-dependent protease